MAAATRKGTITATYWNSIEYWGNQSARMLISTSGSAPAARRGAASDRKARGDEEGPEVAQAVVRAPTSCTASHGWVRSVWAMPPPSVPSDP